MAQRELKSVCMQGVGYNIHKHFLYKLQSKFTMQCLIQKVVSEFIAFYAVREKFAVVCSVVLSGAHTITVRHDNSVLQFQTKILACISYVLYIMVRKFIHINEIFV